MMASFNNLGARMGTRLLSSLAPLFLMSLLLSAGTAVAQQPKARAFFAFGDSYADTGNQPKTGSCQQPPYGETYPGTPSGRCGNGAIQTDFLADVIGLKTPTPYNFIQSQGSATGVNFAIAGSGVTYALGVLPLGSEIDFLELTVNSGVFSPEFLSESVFFISNAGNDYNGNFSATQLPNVVEAVIEGTALALQRLYALGARNIMVSGLSPLNCVPTITAATNYTFCPNATAPAIALHNQLLLNAVAQLNLLPGANIIILDEFKAFSFLLNNPQLFGITDRLAPCCAPTVPGAYCGLKDANGNDLFTLCPNPATHLFWDNVHPVQTAWQAIVGLFANSRGYVIGARNLNVWLSQLSRASSPAPAPTGVTIGPGAEGQLDTAYNALILRPDFAESIGLLQGMNLGETLRTLPEQTVTVFIPDNQAYTLKSQFFLDHLYGNDQVPDVVSYHVVEGFYDLAKLQASSKLNLTTVSNLTLPVNPTPQGVFVGLNNSIVTVPDLYVEPGKVAVHGIDQLLLPPNLVFS